LFFFSTKDLQIDLKLPKADTPLGNALLAKGPLAA
jgi:hypothetical protein